ncbi:putative Casein kinase I [Blattamonas nauphoetae]|uniref:non-specific serine/threonine protein kinase n=1 Tax=Blattamonas nauphoetae TaxID=2049346 RepID=A0ABQ9XC25_9EUKA|nr:putative Casein kinase I [Blattamonas nauphoetae]
METPPASSIPTLVNECFKLSSKKPIGKGGFGTIFVVVDIHTMKEYAAKFEKKGKGDLLSFEHHILNQIQSEQGFTLVQYYGEQDGFLILVFDLLGRNLEDRFNCCCRRFSIETIAHIGIQCLQRLEQLHSIGYLHRDVKPENFVFGRDEKMRQIYLIDFGLSKRFVDRKTKQHIPFRTGKSLTGTPRYATVPAHLGVEQGRRDDVESLGYILLYFLKGSLPWQGIRCLNAERKYQIIGAQKMKTSVEQLCHHCPVEISTFFTYTMSLQMSSEPNYAFLRNLLFQMATNESAKRSRTRRSLYQSQQQFMSCFNYEWLRDSLSSTSILFHNSDEQEEAPNLHNPPRFFKMPTLTRTQSDRGCLRLPAKLSKETSSPLDKGKATPTHNPLSLTVSTANQTPNQKRMKMM